MVMSEKDSRELNDKLEAQKHSIRRFLTIKINDLKHEQEKENQRKEQERQRNERDMTEIKDLLMKMYGQSVDTHAEIEVLKTKYEFMGIKISDLQSSENKNEVKIDAHIKKMGFYLWVIDNKKKIIISAPIIIGLVVKLKEPIKQYFFELIKIWS